MHPQRYFVMLALCGLLTGPTSAAARCVVKGKAALGAIHLTWYLDEQMAER